MPCRAKNGKQPPLTSSNCIVTLMVGGTMHRAPYGINCGGSNGLQDKRKHLGSLRMGLADKGAPLAKRRPDYEPHDPCHRFRVDGGTWRDKGHEAAGKRGSRLYRVRVRRNSLVADYLGL